MGKASVVVVYIVIALFLLLLLSYTPRNSNSHQHRRLRLRSNFSFSQPPVGRGGGGDHAIPFDPIVADIERRREDREWERTHFSLPHQDHAPGEEAQPEWEDFMDAEDYLNNGERFNLTRRMVALFPNIDLDPVDGFLSAEELTEWNLKQQTKDVMHRTEREMELHDKNHDRLVSFLEYDPPSWARPPSDDHNSSKIDVGWWSEEHFNASDVDGDGLLNLTEFNDFLHPADSTSPKLIRWLCKAEIRERDRDKDGKLDFQEFFHGLFDSIRDYNEVYNASHQSFDSREPLAKKLFSELDRDNDGLLSEEDLKSVIGKLHPSERYYAKQQADRAIEEADRDKDGRLSLHEMVEHPYAFYSSIFTDEDDYEYDFRDELR